jgi:hypothetical protein
MDNTASQPASKHLARLLSREHKFLSSSFMWDVDVGAIVVESCLRPAPLLLRANTRHLKDKDTAPGMHGMRVYITQTNVQME